METCALSPAPKRAISGVSSGPECPCISTLRLCPGEGLHHAWVHAEAGQPLSHAMAEALLLPVPQQTGVERRGRISGEFWGWHLRSSGALGLPHSASCLCLLCLRNKGCYGLTFSVRVKFLPGIKAQVSFERQGPEPSSLTESMEAGERNGGMGEEQSRRGQSQLMARRTQHTPRCLSGPLFPH